LGAHRSLSAGQFDDCVLLATVGFDHGFQPVTFSLEPGYWISLDLRGATIAHGGQETRIDLGLAAMSGVVFLPVEHTELTIGQEQSVRRHFIEFFVWLPGQSAHDWNLRWLVFEAGRKELVSVASATLMTGVAARPPAGTSLDVHALVRLRVNDQGKAEWVVLSGPDRGSGLIESESERRASATRDVRRR